MTLSSLFIYSDTYWEILGLLSLIVLGSSLWISNVKNILIQSLTSIASGVLLLSFIYNFGYAGIIYDSQDTLDIEQSAYINGEVLVVQKKGDAIRASSPWLKNVSNIMGANNDNQVHMDNLLISCLKNKGYKLK